MGTKLQHYLGAVILLFWGATMVYFYASGRIEVYLAEEFRIYPLVAGLGLLVLGVFHLLTGKIGTGCAHDHEDGEDHGHGEHGKVFSLVLLVVLVAPLLLAMRYSQDGFSRHAVVNKGLYHPNYAAAAVSEDYSLKSTDPGETPAAPAGGTGVSGSQGASTESAPPAKATEKEDEWGEYTLADLEAQVGKSPEGNYLLTVPQLFYTGGDEELQRVIEGLPVETVAQVMPEKIRNADGKRLRAFRLFIECCAADARPLSIPIEFPEGVPEYEEMGWVKVIGLMRYSVEEGITVPVLEVVTMEPTEPPDDAMMF
ncbi:MAG: DUF1980 domain-containing protein [Verrucomicrobiales bacterium]